MCLQSDQLEQLKGLVAGALAKIADSILSAVVQCVVTYLISLFQIAWLDQLLNTLSGWVILTIIASFGVLTIENFVYTRIRKERKKLEEEPDSSLRNG